MSPPNAPDAEAGPDLASQTDAAKTPRGFAELVPEALIAGLPPVPFFSRLGVKHGLVVAALMLMAMIVIASQQLRQTLDDVEQNAVVRGESIANGMAPLVNSLLRQHDLEGVQRSLEQTLRAEQDIEYLQIVETSGKVLLSDSSAAAKDYLKALPADWLSAFSKRNDLDLRPVAVRWAGSRAGVDIFVALLDEPLLAGRGAVLAAPHLRVGLSVQRVLKHAAPSAIQRLLIFMGVTTGIIIAGLAVLLLYVMRPLRELHQGMKAVAAGNLDYEVPVYSRDEIGRVVLAFNATVRRLRDAFEQIEALAIRDALTGLPNRRIFDETLAGEAARSRRYGHSLGLIILDLDRFKNINDTHGHPAGDEVLKFVGRTLVASVRETDLVARIGGEEFAVLLPETGAPEVQRVAEKLRAVVEAGTPEARNGLPSGVRITASAGVACGQGRRVTPEAVIAAADAALYAAKNDGRNRVAVARSIIT